MTDKDTPAINFRKDLNYDKLTHQALGFLITNRIEAEVYHKERKVLLAVEKNMLAEKLNITKEELFVVTSNLKNELEIDTYDVDFFGYFAKPIAVNSYVSKKYLNKKKNEIRETRKYYMQIIAPILASLIAVLSITLNMYQWRYNTQQKVLKKEIGKEQEYTRNQLNLLVEKTKNMDSVLLGIKKKIEKTNSVQQSIVLKNKVYNLLLAFCLLA
jgi:hypothetical protein